MKNLFLSGQNIYLRALSMEDLGLNYISWFNNAEVCYYNSHHVFPYTLEKGEKYIQRIANSENSNLVLAIILKETNQHIGNISLQNIDLINRNAEFAIIIGESSCWGKGYSKEAGYLIVNHGFSEMNLHRIYCGTSINNKPLRQLALYLGMKEEGRKRESQFKHGQYFDIIEYGVLEKEFFKIFREVNIKDDSK